MRQFTKRNLTLYFRDKASVFFSLLAVMITFLLYIFVFRNLYGVNFLSEISDIREITDVWAICGILAAPTVTTPLGALWVLVDDRKRKLSRDFYASPVARWKMTGGYLMSSFLIGIIMTCALLLVMQIYLLIMGGSLFSLQQYLMILGVIAISTFSGAGLVLFFVSFFQSDHAYTGCSIVMGTLMGFVCGNYIPMGLLPEAVQTVIKFFPVAHTSVLLRQIIVKEPMQNIFDEFGMTDMSWFSQFMGIEFQFGDYVAKPWVHAAVLIVTGVVFYALAIASLSRKRKK